MEWASNGLGSSWHLKPSKTDKTVDKGNKMHRCMAAVSSTVLPYYEFIHLLLFESGHFLGQELFSKLYDPALLVRIEYWKDEAFARIFYVSRVRIHLQYGPFKSSTHAKAVFLGSYPYLPYFFTLLCTLRFHRQNNFWATAFDSVGRPNLHWLDFNVIHNFWKELVWCCFISSDPCLNLRRSFRALVFYHVSEVNHLKTWKLARWR